MTDSEVTQDIQNKTRQSVRVEMVDGKILACFCYEKQGEMGYCGEYVNYDKVFDTWKDFTKYADLFFTLE